MTPRQPPNQDQEAIPKRTGEAIGEPEPLSPGPEPDGDRVDEDEPLPEEETYERGSDGSAGSE